MFIGILAMVGSLVLLAGVPVALAWFVGNPLPTTAPSRDWLTADVSFAFVIKLLAVLVWIVWAHFVVCFLTEWRAVRSGRMPGHVFFGGGSQLVARRLVAATLLLAGGAGIAQGFAAGLTHADTHVEERPNAVHAVQGEQPASGHRLQADRGHRDHVTKICTVQPPEGRHHDTLWGIAERHLGEPMRWREIYELNKDRLQPDGGRLTDADLIRPGWQLRMPADARGPGIAILEAAAPSVRQDASGTETGHEVRAQAGGQHAETARSEHAGVDLGSLLAGGGLVLAGIVTALTARRGPYGTPSEEEAQLRLAANAGRADLLDKALRVLAEGKAAAGEPLPDLTVAYVSDDQVVAHFAGNPGEPLSPWFRPDDANSWTVRSKDLAGLQTTGPAPYPALVNIATLHGYEVMIDLEYATGLVALGGDVEVAREVAMSLVVDLATHAWSDHVEVTMVGFGDDLAEVAPQRIRTVVSLEEALNAAEQQAGRAHALLASLGADGVLVGRSRGRHPELGAHVLVLSAPPTAEETQRLRALVGAARTPFAAVCVGDAAGARWRFSVSSNGAIDLGVLGLSGTARRYTRAAQAEIRELLLASADEAAERRRSVELAPSALVTDQVRRSQTAGAEAPAAVRLLGPVEVAGPGEAVSAHRALLSELVVMTALHPQGLHDAVLRSGLWPRGVSDDVVDRTIAETQQWLGRGADGGPRLVQDDAGLWHLADCVYVDLVELQHCATPDAGGEVSRLTRGLALVRGEAFSDVPVGRYGWLAFHRSARDTRLLAVSMASRAAELLAAAGDRRGAAQALRQGLVLVPPAESLWRDLIRLYGGDDPNVRAVVEEMYRTIPDRPLEPETEALVADLAPGAHRGWSA